MSTYCVELLSLPADRTKILLIRQRPSGQFLQRVNPRSELLRDTQHDEMDDAMHRAYSKYGPIFDGTSVRMMFVHVDYAGARSEPGP